MQISQIFRKAIDRKIEDVIKVDVTTEEIVADEIAEYVVTENIAESFVEILDSYQESIQKPNESTTVWISGFFGSGKSSFAKVLGYILENPAVMGKPATDHFLARTDNSSIAALLNTIHTQAPTKTVFVDLSTGKDVLHEGESPVLPLYRALLRGLGYSQNVVLAELEYILESDGTLDRFIELFGSWEGAHGSWEQRRDSGLARAEASRAMSLLEPKTYPSSDSWSISAAEPMIDANWFALRAIELLKRRGDGAKRLAFVVDEVGQYVSGSVERMLDLQGLAEAVQKHRGTLWLMVTSQEALNAVVDSLEGRQVELARVQSRFPIRVDLLPADIDEVVGKRVLDKNAAGQDAVRAVFAANRNKTNTNVRLDSPRRGDDLAEEEFIRLYPMVHYQVQLLIDAVSARRAQGRATPMLAGSSRTLIKTAQQLVVDPHVGLGPAKVGALVTLDRAYELLEPAIPTSWQAEVNEVAEKYGAESYEAATLKVIALCMDVASLPLDVGNLAVLLHPSVDAESVRPDVQLAVEKLEKEDVIRLGDSGYRLQSPEEKDWETARRALEASAGDRSRLRKQLLKDELAGLAVSSGRTFKVAVTVEGERILDGDISLVIAAVSGEQLTEMVAQSRESSFQSTLWWTYSESPETVDALTEVYRSDEMIRRNQIVARGSVQNQLLSEERDRRERARKLAVQLLTADIARGSIVFHGMTGEPSAGALKPSAQAAILTRLPEIYPRLGMFTAPVKRDDAFAVLRSTNLEALPDHLREASLALVRLTRDGYELNTGQDPLAEFVRQVQSRGTASGAALEQFFGQPPFGASLEVVEVLAAACIRAGVVEAVHQGQRIRSADDRRLDGVFNTTPGFRGTSFAPISGEPPVPDRTELAARIQELTGKPPGIASERLAAAVREEFGPLDSATDRVITALSALGLKVPEAVVNTRQRAESFRTADDFEVVTSALKGWADLVEGRDAVVAMDRVVAEDLQALKSAVEQTRLGAGGLGEETNRQLDDLRDLLTGSDLPSQLASIKSLTNEISTARSELSVILASELAEEATRSIESIKAAYPHAEQSTLAAAVAPVQSLLPEGDETLDVNELKSRLAELRSLADSAKATLDKATDVVRLSIRDLAPDEIADEDQLNLVIDRVREAASEELGKNHKIRLW